MSEDQRVRVAAVNDYELVVEGLAALLARYPDRLEVVDAIVIGEPLAGPVDVALYDTYGREGIGVGALKELLAMPEVAKVAVFTMELTPDTVSEARQLGVAGFLSKALFDAVDIGPYTGGFLPFFSVPWDVALLGLGASLVIGLISGAVPAAQAARLSVVNGLRKVV